MEEKWGNTANFTDNLFIGSQGYPTTKQLKNFFRQKNQK